MQTHSAMPKGTLRLPKKDVSIDLAMSDNHITDHTTRHVIHTIGRTPGQRRFLLVGRTLRRLRRYFALPLIVLAILWLEPLLPAHSTLFDTLTDWLGVAIALLGQWLRCWTWGSNAAPDTGLRTRGPYALMQHPLYVGNFCIAVGLLVIFNNPWAYVGGGVFFAMLYSTIARVEETRLQDKFNTMYQAYIATGVPRFLPSWRRLKLAMRSTRPFSWRKAYQKEYESVLGLATGAILLEMYEEVHRAGIDRAWGEVVLFLALLGALGGLAVSLYLHKVRTYGASGRHYEEFPSKGR